MTEFADLVAKHGPFPLGIFVGIILARMAYSKALHYLNEEKKALRIEKKQLRETVEAQQNRIDKLHQEAYPLIAQGERQ